MHNKHFDPRKFIDRESEQELFAEMLLFKDKARILTIRDKGGMGKSHLLEKFQYRCRTNKPERIPISLVELDRLPDNSPLVLIEQIVQDLDSFQVACPRYTRYKLARLSGDFITICESAYWQAAMMQRVRVGINQSARERVNHAVLLDILVKYFNESELHNLCFELNIDYESLPSQGKDNKARELIEYARRYLRLNELVAHCRQLRPQADWHIVDRIPTQDLGVAVPFDDSQSWDEPFAVPRSATAQKLTQEQQIIAQEVCIRAFFDDLSTICAEDPIVLMLDAYERCDDTLKEWIEKLFLERLFFSLERQAHRLILVVSGRELPHFERRWSIEDCDALVRSVEELGKWKRSDVADCLRVHGYDNYEDLDVDAFHRLILIGIAPSEVVGLIGLAVANRRSA
jgi:hypothetical protein